MSGDHGSLGDAGRPGPQVGVPVSSCTGTIPSGPPDLQGSTGDPGPAGVPGTPGDDVSDHTHPLLQWV